MEYVDVTRKTLILTYMYIRVIYDQLEICVSDVIIQLKSCYQESSIRILNHVMESVLHEDEVVMLGTQSFEIFDGR